MRFVGPVPDGVEMIKGNTELLSERPCKSGFTASRTADYNNFLHIFVLQSKFSIAITIPLTISSSSIDGCLP